MCQQKPPGLGSVLCNVTLIPRQIAMVAAVAQLSMTLCRLRGSGSFGLRVAVVEPSAKTSGFKLKCAPNFQAEIPTLEALQTTKK